VGGKRQSVDTLKAATENLTMRRFVIALVMAALLLALPTAALGAQSAAAPGEASGNAPGYVPPPAWKSVEVGDFYLRRKDYRGALSRYQEAIHTDPDYAPAYLQLGKVDEKLGRKRQALAAYQKYLKALPSEKQAEEAKEAHHAIRRLEHELRNSDHAPEKSQK
jgi:tetratricopeptide (TPR) repeat protein